MKHLSSIEATANIEVYHVFRKLEGDINSAFDDSVDEQTWKALLNGCFANCVAHITPLLHTVSRNAASEITNEF